MVHRTKHASRATMLLASLLAAACNGEHSLTSEFSPPPADASVVSVDARVADDGHATQSTSASTTDAGPGTDAAAPLSEAEVLGDWASVPARLAGIRPTGPGGNYGKPAASEGLVLFAARGQRATLTYFTALASAERYQARVRGAAPHFEVLLERVAEDTSGAVTTLQAIVAQLPTAKSSDPVPGPGEPKVTLDLYLRRGDRLERMAQGVPRLGPDSDCAGLVSLPDDATCPDGLVASLIPFDLRCGACVPPWFVCATECGTETCTLGAEDLEKPTCP
jgi:hypothetical protein